MAGIRNRLLGLLESIKRPQITTLDLRQPMVASQAIAPQLFTLAAGDGEDVGYRRITSASTLRDLNPMMHDRMLDVCYFIAVTTPFGKRIVEIITDFVIGKRNSVRVTFKDPAAQEVWNKFYDDPYNKMATTIREWCNELTTFGELCVPVAVNAVDGFVRIGYIDPTKISAIQFAELTTRDGLVGLNFPYAVRVCSETSGAEGIAIPVVRKIDDPNDPDFGRLRGQCFYWSINKAKSASRGFSELFSLADWIDVFDQMIFDFADKVRFLNSMVWHYTIEGADEKKVDDFKNRMTKDPPKQGGALFSNEKVTVEPKTPDFKGQDMAEGARMVKLYGLGGAGLPAWFFADPVDSNRSTAQEMSGPTGKKFESRQGHFAECLDALADFVIDCAVQAGTLSEGVVRTRDIELPEVLQRDLKEGAATMQTAVPALVTGVQEGWIRQETAARAFHRVLSTIGVDIDDSKAEFEDAQVEKTGRAANDQNSLFPQDNLKNALEQANAGEGDPAAPVVQ